MVDEMVDEMVDGMVDEMVDGFFFEQAGLMVIWLDEKENQLKNDLIADNYLTCKSQIVKMVLIFLIFQNIFKNLHL